MGDITGYIDAPDFQMSPSGGSDGLGSPIWIDSERSSPFHARKSLDLTSLFCSPSLGASSRPLFPTPISADYLHLSKAYIELHCPLKLMTFSSQKEVVYVIILGVWVWEEPRGPRRTLPSLETWTTPEENGKSAS